MAYKFRKGTRIRIQDNVASTGKYGPYRGEYGTVIETDRWGGSIRIKLDNNITLDNVGASVLTRVNKNQDKLTNDNNDITREALEERKEKLEKALNRVNSKLEFLDETESNIFSEKLFKAHKIMKLAGSVTQENRNEIAELIQDLL